MKDEKLNRAADAMADHFKERIASLADAPFEQTGVTVPARSVWLGYAAAVLKAIEERIND